MELENEKLLYLIKQILMKILKLYTKLNI